MYNDRRYALEPDWKTFSRCDAKEEGMEPVSTFLVFGGIHFLFDVTGGHESKPAYNLDS